MGLNKKGILKISGMCCRITGLLMIPTVIAALIMGEYETALHFTLVAAGAVAVSFIVRQPVRKASPRLKMRDGFLAVTLIWFIAAVIGCIPYILSGAITDPFKAFFEACSGFTTTGASVLQDLEGVPASILFWRAFSGWIGGMWMIVLAIALMPALGLSGQAVSRPETPGPALEKITPNMLRTAKYLVLIYGGMTIAEIIFLFAGGMNFFDSLLCSFSTIGTGGFAGHAAGIGYYSSAYVDIVITVFMLLAGMSFTLHYTALKHGPKVYFRDSEFRFYILIILIFTAIITIDLYARGIYPTVGGSMDKAAFQTISMVSTTGFTNAGFDVWPELSKMLLFVLMFIGGCSGSAAGGIKAARILIVLKYIRKGIAIRLHPSAVMDVRISGRRVSSVTMSSVVMYVFLYAFVLAAGSLLISFDDADLVTGISGVLSCMSNTGPALGLIGAEGGYNIFSDFSTTVLSVLMIAGRMELVTFFVLFTPNYWKPER